MCSHGWKSFHILHAKFIFHTSSSSEIAEMLMWSSPLYFRSYVYLYPQIEAIIESIRNYRKLPFYFFISCRLVLKVMPRYPRSPRGPFRRKFRNRWSDNEQWANASDFSKFTSQLTWDRADACHCLQSVFKGGGKLRFCQRNFMCGKNLF